MTHNIKNNAAENQVNARYIILEDSIPYDWDDYNVYGAVLYDTVEHKIISTQYGHGTDMKYRNESVNLDAVPNMYKEIINVMLNSLNIVNDYLFEKIAIMASRNNHTAIPVKVIRGRKFKGDGYLVYTIEKPVMYGLGAYKGEVNHHPVIVDVKTGTENEVNSFGYLKFDQEFIDNYRKNLINTFDATYENVAKIAHAWAYNMSYSACDRDNYMGLLNRLGYNGIDSIEIPEIISDIIAANIAADKHAAEEARKQKMAEKMPAILEWVKNNTDKTGDDAVKLAEHIFDKYN